MLGPAPAGIVIKALGTASAFLIDAVTFLFILVPIYGLPRTTPAPKPRAEGKHFGHDILEGLQYVRRDPAMRALMIVMTGVNLCVSGPIIVGLAALAKFRFGTPRQSLRPRARRRAHSGTVARVMIGADAIRSFLVMLLFFFSGAIYSLRGLRGPLETGIGAESVERQKSHRQMVEHASAELRAESLRIGKQIAAGGTDHGISFRDTSNTRRG